MTVSGTQRFAWAIVYRTVSGEQRFAWPILPPAPDRDPVSGEAAFVWEIKGFDPSAPGTVPAFWHLRVLPTLRWYSQASNVRVVGRLIDPTDGELRQADVTARVIAPNGRVAEVATTRNEDGEYYADLSLAYRPGVWQCEFLAEDDSVASAMIEIPVKAGAS